MSDQRRFGRRRRGMHFKPSGGPKPSKGQEREAQQARAEAIGDDQPITGERLFEPQRHARQHRLRRHRQHRRRQERGDEEPA